MHRDLGLIPLDQGLEVHELPGEFGWRQWDRACLEQALEVPPSWADTVKEDT